MEKTCPLVISSEWRAKQSIRNGPIIKNVQEALSHIVREHRRLRQSNILWSRHLRHFQWSRQCRLTSLRGRLPMTRMKSILSKMLLPLLLWSNECPDRRWRSESHHERTEEKKHEKWRGWWRRRKDLEPALRIAKQRVSRNDARTRSCNRH